MLWPMSKISERADLEQYGTVLLKVSSFCNLELDDFDINPTGSPAQKIWSSTAGKPSKLSAIACLPQLATPLLEHHVGAAASWQFYIQQHKIMYNALSQHFITWVEALNKKTFH